MSETFQRDDEGNIIDPPVIPENEQAVSDAYASGDTERVQQAQSEYDDARNQLVSEIESDGDEDASDDDGTVAESDEGESTESATGTGDTVDTGDTDTISDTGGTGPNPPGTDADNPGINPGANNPAVGNQGQQGAADAGATGTMDTGTGDAA